MLKSLLVFARIAARERNPRPYALAAPDAHLIAAEQWLCRAQDASSDGGVSYGYTWRGGWGPSYPETSGYIATTFLRLARQRDPAYAERARRTLDWLVRVQNTDGSFANPRFGPEGIVFDTGQVLFGLAAGYRVTAEPRYLEAARRAAGWLVAIADAEGRWTRNEHLGTPHVYNTRTAWALLQLNELEFDAAREAIARCNLDWALAEQQPSGFFDHCSFRPGQAPYTHTIAYTVRGLLESGLLLHESRYLDAALRCAEATLPHLRADGFLPGALSTDGASASGSCCLTGNCQFAIIWARLSATLSRPYRPAVVRALDYVMTTQDLNNRNPALRGAIKGSQPVWGRYAPLSFPNWATKFFVDAMWLRQELGG